MKKTKILVIEDEYLLSEAYRRILEYQGYDVTVAGDGQAGLKQLDIVKPNLILLDVLMPKLDGIGFLQRSELKRRYPNTKVVACTNLSDPQTAEQMAMHGADCQVLKSDLSPKQLAALVKELLAE